MAQVVPADRSNPDGAPGAPGGPPPVEPPRAAYQAALARYDASLLSRIRGGLGLTDGPARTGQIAASIAERLGETRVAERLAAELDPEARLALSLFALSETPEWPSAGLSHALACLGVDPSPAIERLLASGLIAVRLAEGAGVADLSRAAAGDGEGRPALLAHPAAMAAARTALPQGDPLPGAGPARMERTADGLEPVLRLAAIWQRVEEAPLRTTQTGSLYKRDRDRLEDDPVLAGPIADALEPLPDMAGLWLALARGVGLVTPEPGTDRITAAPAGFWAENAFHLPQMIATRWLGLRGWHEQGGLQPEGHPVELALPYARIPILLWLATLDEGAWVALDDLAAHLGRVHSGWDRLAIRQAPPEPKGRSGPKPSRTAKPAGPSPLEAVLLGAAYQLGLVAAAEETPGGRRLVRLSPLGRYVLALGPPPPPRPAFEHFLFVQPNFEIIAYRQGLTPGLIGDFSRFTRWNQVGAALELRLTPESAYRGLEGGLGTDAMLGLLTRHSPRPLPPGIAEALRTWAGRRERVTYYASSTLVEFATPEDLRRALELWPPIGDARAAPVPVSDRLLLVEDESTIPFQRFRLAGSRDYRRPPEACVEAEPDGVTLSLDLGRSDLLVDAELARFTDELSPEVKSASGNPRRRFRVSAESLARGAEAGLSLAILTHWYERRTGGVVPPAVRLLLRASSGRTPPLTTSRPLVLHTPTPELLDGLLQHPDTCSLLGERLGPTTAIIPDESVPQLRLALGRLGLPFTPPEGPSSRAGGPSAG